MTEAQGPGREPARHAAAVALVWRQRKKDSRHVRFADRIHERQSSGPASAIEYSDALK